MHGLKMVRRFPRERGLCRLAIVIAAVLCLVGCDGSLGDPAMPTDGDPAQGAKLITHFGCGTCHTIPGIAGANGLVGPPLDHIGERTIIAGLLPNTPENLETWLKNPQAIVPGNAMPNMELNDNDAKDVAAYLYTLR
jgi:cytochrome c1